MLPASIRRERGSFKRALDPRRPHDGLYPNPVRTTPVSCGVVGIMNAGGPLVERPACARSCPSLRARGEFTGDATRSGANGV